MVQNSVSVNDAAPHTALPHGKCQREWQTNRHLKSQIHLEHDFITLCCNNCVMFVSVL